MTISVTRALAQIKSLDARIAEASGKAFITYAVNGKTGGGSAVADAVAVIRANLQSVQDMIALRQKLKSAVVASNAVTKVTVGGKEMTVAQAIERKGSIQQEQFLLTNMVAQHRRTVKEVETINQNVQVRLDKLIETAVGKDRKVDESEISAITEPFRQQNQASLVDPAELEKLIAALEADIANFLAEVDYSLSESNAVTQITVE